MLLIKLCLAAGKPWAWCTLVDRPLFVKAIFFLSVISVFFWEIYTFLKSFWVTFENFNSLKIVPESSNIYYRESTSY